MAGRGLGPLGPHPRPRLLRLFRDLFFDAIVPTPGRLTLEVGCGEGRVARDLAQRGHTVVALDGSPTLTAMAAATDPGGRYVVGDAAALPFGDGRFDIVVAYNSLMDVADMPASVREASRVLEPGGRLCVCVTHPTADAGKFQSKAPDAPFVIPGAYLGRHRIEDIFERDASRSPSPAGATPWRSTPAPSRTPAS
jgi:SAM-dependent methyltransferase